MDWVGRLIPICDPFWYDSAFILVFCFLGQLAERGRNFDDDLDFGAFVVCVFSVSVVHCAYRKGTG